MAARGLAHYRSGPHLLPSGKPEHRTNRGLVDPANGELVPRCAVCGTSRNVLDFELRLGGKHAGHFEICDPCYRWENPPPLADPLDVPTA